MNGFCKSTRRTLFNNGEILVVHKTNRIFCERKIEQLVAQCRLYVVKKTMFSSYDYPGYQNKYGKIIIF